MKIKAVIYVLVLIGLAFLVGGHYLNSYWHKKVKSSPKMFVYQTFWGVPNSALIIEDLKYKSSIIAYYDTIESNPKSNPIINFPLKTLPQYEPVYVIGYSDDGLLVDVVSYYDRGLYLGGSYLRGWVYVKTVHKKPPSSPSSSESVIPKPDK